MSDLKPKSMCGLTSAVNHLNGIYRLPSCILQSSSCSSFQLLYLLRTLFSLSNRLQTSRPLPQRVPDTSEANRDSVGNRNLMAEMIIRTLRGVNHRDSKTGCSIPYLFENAIIDAKIVGEVIKSHTNDWKLAYAFFNWASSGRTNYQHGTEAYNSMVDILGKALEFDLAWKLVERMKRNGVSPNHITFRTMFKRYSCAHMVGEAIDAYRRSEEFGLKDKTCFFNLIDALCEHKHVMEAENLTMGENCEHPLDTKTFNIILRGWLKIGWWSKCRGFWEARKKLGVDPDVHSYTIYMDILTKSRKPYKAFKVFEEMRKRGDKLDVVAYNTAIHAIGQAGDVDQSLHVFQDMLESGCHPTIATYNTILKLLCNAGRVQQALALLDKMPKRGFEPNAITYHCFFSSMTEPKEILQLFDEMIDRGCTPTIETYVMLIKKFGKWGYLRPVFDVWKTMEDHGISPDQFAYDALIDALIEKGSFDLARKYDREMMAKGLSGRPRKELRTEFSSGESDDGCT